jgi:hypothetical protein
MPICRSGPGADPAPRERRPFNSPPVQFIPTPFPFRLPPCPFRPPPCPFRLPPCPFIQPSFRSAHHHARSGCRHSRSSRRHSRSSSHHSVQPIVIPVQAAPMPIQAVAIPVHPGQKNGNLAIIPGIPPHSRESGQIPRLPAAAPGAPAGKTLCGRGAPLGAVPGRFSRKSAIPSPPLAQALHRRLLQPVPFRHRPARPANTHHLPPLARPRHPAHREDVNKLVLSQHIVLDRCTGPRYKSAADPHACLPKPS